MNPKITSEELSSRADKAMKILESCTLCPNNCKVNRPKGQLGFCKSGAKMLVSSYGPHFGEEPPLVGTKGSGTIFFAGCNMRCSYCQNADISQTDEGKKASRETSEDELARMMLKLQELGCHNINLVTPTHFVPQIMKALAKAAAHLLRIPIVYNCGGYESVTTLKLLEGFIDIYMPDAKYGNSIKALKYSGVRNYTENMQSALMEMHRQVGDLALDGFGVAARGMIIRHLVLPGDAANSEAVLKFIATRVSDESYVNIMRQYKPCYNAKNFPELNRAITETEYRKAVEYASGIGLSRGFQS